MVVIVWYVVGFITIHSPDLDQITNIGTCIFHIQSNLYLTVMVGTRNIIVWIRKTRASGEPVSLT